MHSVTIKSINRAEINQAVRLYAGHLRSEYPEIIRIIWFGSWVSGYPGPGSDVDLCLVVSACDQPRHKRFVKYLPVGFPVGIDLMVYTQAEFAALERASPGLMGEILKGVDL